jgi:hypothetical protein
MSDFNNLLNSNRDSRNGVMMMRNPVRNTFMKALQIELLICFLEHMVLKVV